jgi:hypothetical protein
MVVLCLMLPIVAQDIVEVWPSKLTVKRRTRDEREERRILRMIGAISVQIFQSILHAQPRDRRKKERKVTERQSRSLSTDRSSFSRSPLALLSTFTDGPLWREICLCCFRPCAAIRASPLRDESAVLHKPLCVAHTVNPGRSYDIDTFREFYLPCPSPSQLDDIIFAPTRKLKDIFLFRQSAIYN